MFSCFFPVDKKGGGNDTEYVRIFEIICYKRGGETKIMIKSVPRKLQGFTLIELLIVIAILGILAAAVLIAINPTKRTGQARDAGRKNDIASIVTEVQAYYTTPGQGIYPAWITPACGADIGGLTILTTSGGLKQVPKDPKAGYNYCYASLASEVSVYASLEQPTVTTNVLWCWRSQAANPVEAATCAP